MIPRQCRYVTNNTAARLVFSGSARSVLSAFSGGYLYKSEWCDRLTRNLGEPPAWWRQGIPQLEPSRQSKVASRLLYDLKYLLTKFHVFLSIPSTDSSFPQSLFWLWCQALWSQCDCGQLWVTSRHVIWLNNAHYLSEPMEMIHSMILASLKIIFKIPNF